MVSKMTTLFKPEFYEGVKKRITNLSEVEEALKLIKEDNQLLEVLEKYTAITNGQQPRSLNLYSKEYKLPKLKPWEDGQILKVRLTLRPTKDNPINFGFSEKELHWWGDRKWLLPGLQSNGDWAVYHGGPDTGAGWETRSQYYSVKEREVGFYLISPVNSMYHGSHHNERISLVKSLRKVTKREIMSNLEKELLKIQV